jgi:lipopolysaccharide transport system permease protein
MSNDSNEYIIKPPKGLMEVNFSELWKYRELFYIFAWRDIKVRYKQTVFGIAWAVFQPFVTMVIFSVIFGRLAAVPSEGVPYPIFVYTGLLLWNYCASALTNASDCLVTNGGIIQKVYFPRLILPLSTAGTPLL